MSWKNESLERLFNPQSIAVIGASNKPDKLGALTLLALKSFEKNVFPVNPRLDSIQGVRCYPTVTSIESPVDLAMIAVGPQQMLSALEDCAEGKVRGAIIFSAGFKELGGMGVEHQRRVKELADKARIAVIGPNCLGAGNPRLNLNATFFPHPVPMKAGSVAMVSQSGGVTGLMLYQASDRGLGVSKFASVGNRVNIDFHDMIRYLRDDSQTDVICLFVEGTEYGREMKDEISKTTPMKPVIVFKVGKTPASRDAALSHTGSLAGNSEIYSGAIKQSGAIEVAGVSEMIDTAHLLSVCPHRPKGDSVAIVTHTLGIALIAAQTLELDGAILPPPSREAAKSIQSLLNMPIEIPIKNPVDLLAQGWANPDIFGRAFDIILNDDRYDSVMIVFAPNYQEGIGGGIPIEKIVQASSKVSKPIVSILSSPEQNKPPGYEILEAAGIPFYSNPQRASKALVNVIKIAKKNENTIEPVTRSAN
ncbi:MAG: CoA-binding protein [Candidatus Thorarchaeota archaeon]|nr:CoA-binding protein [Candidatus Thorarchaeota archaeon]